MPDWSKIEEEYGITLLKRQKVRDVYKLFTREHGTLCLKSYDIPEPEIRFIAEVFEHLANNGFNYAPKMLLTRHENSWITLNDEHVILTNWVKGRQPSFKKVPHFKKAIRLLAKFHTAGQHFDASDVPSARIRYNWLEERIKSYRDILTDYPRAKRLIPLCEEALERLGDPMILEAVEQEQAASALVHGDYNYPNLVRADSRTVHMIDFENTSMNLRMTDLSHILHRNFPWKGKDMMRWINYYRRKRPLAAPELHLLHLLLLLPYPVVRAIQLKGHPRRLLPTSAQIRKYKRDLQPLIDSSP